MFKIKGLQTILSTLSIAAMMIVATACIGDASVSKRRGVVKDFSVVDGNENGCGASYLNYVSPYDTCVTSCSVGTATTTGYHLATTEELATVKTGLVADGNTSLLTIVNGSANLCVPDITVETRPTNAIDIKSDFCSCLKGKSDIINNCEAFCAAKTASDQPILYINTIMGTDIALNSKLGNLHNWCTVQLANDETNPSCSMIATDGTNTIRLPVNTSSGSNSFNVNILSLTTNRTWILKLVETQTGSAAQSKEFQIRRQNPVTDSNDILGALKVTPINQYTCMTYGGKVDATGNIIRTTFARIFYYFASNEDPAPVAPAGGTNQSQIVCHDEQLHPGADNPIYPRLELIPGAYSMWDRADTRFVAKAVNAGKLTINKILEDRLSAEYNITGSSIDLFRLVSYPNRPASATTISTNIPLGYIMIPFTDTTTGKTYCPGPTEFTGSQPLLNLLGEYMDQTEGIYLAEKQAETFLDGTTYKTLYGTMFVRESTLLSYGFYIENGLKIKANSSSMNSKTIYYYWPTSTTADPLTEGGRKLFTVRTPGTLNGNVPTGQSTNEATTDKRIGCIPKT
jgi:hypothetical protein